MKKAIWSLTENTAPEIPTKQHQDILERFPCQNDSAKILYRNVVETLIDFYKSMILMPLKGHVTFTIDHKLPVFFVDKHIPTPVFLPVYHALKSEAA